MLTEDERKRLQANVAPAHQRRKEVNAAYRALMLEDAHRLAAVSSLEKLKGGIEGRIKYLRPHREIIASLAKQFGSNVHVITTDLLQTRNELYLKYRAVHEAAQRAMQFPKDLRDFPLEYTAAQYQRDVLDRFAASDVASKRLERRLDELALVGATESVMNQTFQNVQADRLSSTYTAMAKAKPKYGPIAQEDRLRALSIIFGLETPVVRQVLLARKNSEYVKAESQEYLP